MTLSDLELVHGVQFHVACRVRRPLRKIAANGANYLCFTIEDCSRTVKAYAWPEQCDLSVPLHDLDRALIVGKLRRFNGTMLAIVSSIQSLADTPDNSILLIPRSMCPKPDLLTRLSGLIDGLTNDDLAYFVKCAEMVRHFTAFNQDMQDLAVVAALLHDIGKIVTLRTSGDILSARGCS
jgi:3'-5' exoribonuclease